LTAVIEEAGEESLAYLMTCYQAAKVLAAAGNVEGAVEVMNVVPKTISQDPAHAAEVSLLALEIGEGIRRLGDPITAEKMVGLAHEIRREQYGRYHPRVGLSALYAARVCFDQERWSDARKFFEVSVVGFGPYHPFNAVAYADRVYANQLVAPDAPPFPEFVMSAPKPYWRRLLNHVANTTLDVPLDVRMAVLLNVCSEAEEAIEDPGDLTRPVLVAAYQYAREADTESAADIKELLEERGWAGEDLDRAVIEPDAGSATEEFWCSPERDTTEGEQTETESQFTLFEGAAEATAGRTSEAVKAFERVLVSRGEDTLEHWAAKGCLQLIDRGWNMRHSQFKPEMRAIEAYAMSKLPKSMRSKLKGIELAARKGTMDVTFVESQLTDAQQERAAKIVQAALAWVTERSEDAG